MLFLSSVYGPPISAMGCGVNNDYKLIISAPQCSLHFDHYKQGNIRHQNFKNISLITYKYMNIFTEYGIF